MCNDLGATAAALRCNAFGKFAKDLNSPEAPQGIGGGRVGSEEGNGEGGGTLTCPRCGKPLLRIEYKRRGSRLYAYGLHKDGNKYYYHYLGPAKNYEYVSRLHEDLNLSLKGLMEEVEGLARAKDYLDSLAQAIEEQLEGGRLPPRKARALAASIRRLCGLAERLEQHAEGQGAGAATA